MSRGAGVLRSAETLTATAEALTQLGERRAAPRTASWEMTNLLTVASALVAAAYAREETRGCHWRDDFPTVDDRWLGHVVSDIAPTGSVRLTWEGLC